MGRDEYFVDELMKQFCKCGAFFYPLAEKALGTFKLSGLSEEGWLAYWFVMELRNRQTRGVQRNMGC